LAFFETPAALLWVKRSRCGLWRPWCSNTQKSGYHCESQRDV